MSITAIRTIALIVGIGTLLWQVIQLVNGNAQNMFFVADIIFAGALAIAALIKNKPKAIAAMQVAFSGLAGVFAVATFGALTMGTYAFGPFTTTVGLLLCLPCIFFLYKSSIKAGIGS